MKKKIGPPTTGDPSVQYFMLMLIAYLRMRIIRFAAL